LGDRFLRDRLGYLLAEFGDGSRRFAVKSQFSLAGFRHLRSPDGLPRSIQHQNPDPIQAILKAIAVPQADAVYGHLPGQIHLPGGNSHALGRVGYASSSPLSVSIAIHSSRRVAAVAGRALDGGFAFGHIFFSAKDLHFSQGESLLVPGKRNVNKTAADRLLGMHSR